MGLSRTRGNNTKFKPGHAKVGGRKKGSPNKRILIEIPVPLNRLPTITETLEKHGIDLTAEVLKLCGMLPDKNGQMKCELLPHQLASVLLQLDGLKKRESGIVPDPQTPSSTGDRAMSTDELLNCVLKATREEQERRAITDRS